MGREGGEEGEGDAGRAQRASVMEASHDLALLKFESQISTVADKFNLHVPLSLC